MRPSVLWFSKTLWNTSTKNKSEVFSLCRIYHTGTQAHSVALITSKQEGLAMASIARDDPSPLPGMHRDTSVTDRQTDRQTDRHWHRSISASHAKNGSRNTDRAAVRTGSGRAIKNLHRLIFFHTPAISSVGEIHSVDCCRSTKINRPPWIGFTSRMRTPCYTAKASIRFTIPVVCQICRKVALRGDVHAALISWLVQCSVVRQHGRTHYTHHSHPMEHKVR